MLEPLDSQDILKRLGFRCIQPTKFLLKDGSTITVQADGWLLTTKELPSTDREASILRLYHVYYPGGATENLDEVDVMALVSEELFKIAERGE